MDISILGIFYLLSLLKGYKSQVVRVLTSNFGGDPGSFSVYGKCPL